MPHEGREVRHCLFQVSDYRLVSRRAATIAPSAVPEPQGQVRYPVHMRENLHGRGRARPAFVRQQRVNVTWQREHVAPLQPTNLPSHLPARLGTHLNPQSVPGPQVPLGESGDSAQRSTRSGSSPVS
jgi:hypothetical protein